MKKLAAVAIGFVISFSAFAQKALSPDGDMPYFNQGNNVYRPGATCGMTSAAMLMGYWTPSNRRIITPDEIYLRYGTHRKGQTPEGLADIYSDYGYKSVSVRNGTEQKLKSILDKGYPVVFHGYFTNGHIIVIRGYNDRGYIVNDPAGNWLRCYKCGYGRDRDGEKQVYTYSEMNERVMSYPGDLWYSYIVPR